MKIFIIPYRDRGEQKKFFYRHMRRDVLEGLKEGEDYKILFIHQNDKRAFNRGGLKNIGFKIVKDMYPVDYKDITLIFNDVDCMPLNKGLLNYDTERGKIKHFYGVKDTLGGIVSITGNDFEMIDGYSNFWTWGLEDNVLLDRAKKRNLIIDRTNFYNLLDKNILHLMHGFDRKILNKDIKNYINSEMDGLKDIKDLNYVIKGEMCEVTNFSTKYKEPLEGELKDHDVRNRLINNNNNKLKMNLSYKKY
jgi:hypothetical protein